MKLLNCSTMTRRIGTALIPMSIVAIATVLFGPGLGAGLGPEAANARTEPDDLLVNFETPHVHPVDLTPDGRMLLAVNTAAARLEVFDVTGSSPAAVASIPVGLDPVSVRARTNGEAWVVNHISDSVSVVDLSTMTVVDTKLTDNEPADVVFAGSPQRAFVTASEDNSINVFDPTSDADQPLATVSIHGEDPRSLAVSPSGGFVYAAIFESGNRTTAVSGGGSVNGRNVVSRSEGPYGGQNPPPNNGSQFSPPISASAGNPARTAMIVREDAAGRWMDDNNGDWSIFVDGTLAPLTNRVVGWQLADHDVAVINANSLAVTYQDHLMNINMALGVNPSSGRVTVVGTDAINEVRFEPNLNGRFVTVNMAQFSRGGSSTVTDLNPHLDYSTATVSATQRERSIGDPRGVAWNPSGTRAFITGMGSNNVVVLDGSGNRIGRFDVGEGPTGIVVGSNGRGYVMNKFSGSISVVDTNAMTEVAEVPFYDPTPDVIKDGRRFLYDTHLTSGTGHLSCASCHVDARTDRLAWDLGDPQGQADTVAAVNNSSGDLTGGTHTVSSMKGVMLTQTLQNITDFPTMHWRGDREDLFEFNPTFVNLMGRPSQLSTADMAAFEAFLDTIHLPPNPYRRIDDTRPSTVTLPNGQTATSSSMNSLRGDNSRSNNCLSCHYNGRERNVGSNAELGQAFVAPSWAPWYDRLGYWPESTSGSTSGFGFFHDGADDLGGAVRSNTAENQPDMLAEIMTLEGPSGPLSGGERRKDTHAGTGQQITIDGAITSAEQSRLNQLITIANSSSFVSMVANAGHIGPSGVALNHGFRSDGGSAWTADAAGETATTAELLADAADGNPVTFTIVAAGTQNRLGLDIDNDGVRNRDELPATATIVGQVTDEDGSGVPGVGVDLFTATAGGGRDQFLESDDTDGSGNYGFTVDPGCYVLTFVAPDGLEFSNGTSYLNRSTCVEAGQTAMVDAKTAVSGGGNSASIGDRVTSLNGQGVPSVNIDLFTEGRAAYLRSTSTDSTGTYGFDVDPGCYVVTFIAPDGTQFSTGTYLNRSVCVTAGETDNTIDAQLLTGGGGSSIGGTIRDRSGAGQSGIGVDLFSGDGDGNRVGYLRSTTTATGGSYEFTITDPGCYVLTFKAPDGETWVETGSRWMNRQVCLVAGQSEGGVDATLDTGGAGDVTLGGTVTWTAGGLVSGVEVDLFTGTAAGERVDFISTTTTDASGHYRFEASEGCYVVTLIAPTGRVWAATGTSWYNQSTCLDPGQSDLTLNGALSTGG